MNYYFYIIFHRGDKGVLDIVETYPYEADDYALASRLEFTDYSKAYKYAVDLAAKHDLILRARENPENKHDYLD